MRTVDSYIIGIKISNRDLGCITTVIVYGGRSLCVEAATGATDLPKLSTQVDFTGVRAYLSAWRRIYRRVWHDNHTRRFFASKPFLFLKINFGVCLRRCGYEGKKESLRIKLNACVRVAKRRREEVKEKKWWDWGGGGGEWWPRNEKEQKERTRR